MSHNDLMCACLEDYFSCAVLQLDNGKERQFSFDIIFKVPQL